MDKWQHGPIFSRCEPMKIARLQNPGMAMMVFVFVFTPRVKIRPGGDRPVRSVKGQQTKNVYIIITALQHAIPSGLDFINVSQESVHMNHTPQRPASLVTMMFFVIASTYQMVY